MGCLFNLDVLNVIVNIATVVGAVATVFFGVVTFLLARRSNRLQDIVATTSNFPDDMFSKCQILPLNEEEKMPISVDSVFDYISKQIESGKGWTDADYIMILDCPSSWPLNSKITKINLLLFSISGTEVSFECQEPYMKDTENGKIIIVPLKYEQRKKLCCIPWGTKKREKQKLFFRRFYYCPWYELKYFQTITLYMGFHFDNLLLKKQSCSKLELEMIIKNTGKIIDAPVKGTPELSVLSRELHRKKKH